MPGDETLTDLHWDAMHDASDVNPIGPKAARQGPRGSQHDSTDLLSKRFYWEAKPAPSVRIAARSHSNLLIASTM